jgi:hypothetical protein
MLNRFTLSLPFLEKLDNKHGEPEGLLHGDVRTARGQENRCQLVNAFTHRPCLTISMTLSSQISLSNVEARLMSEASTAHLVQQNRFGLTFGPPGSNRTTQIGDSHSWERCSFILQYG